MGCVGCGEARDFFAVFVDVVGGDVGIELADVGEDDVAHDRVAELFGECAEAGGSRAVLGAADDLGEDLAAKAGDVGGLGSAVGARDGLTADDVEFAGGDAVAVAERVEAGVLVEEAGQQPG